MDSNKRIALNSIIIYIRLCIVSLISIIISRIVLDALGASNYGLYNVVGGIVLLLNVINSSMTSTTYRFLAFEIGKKDQGNPNKIFNTSRIIHIVFAIFIMLIGLPIGEYYITNYLNVRPEQISDAQFVFRLSILAAAINTIFVPNQGLLIAYEKFKASASIDILANTIKLLLIYFFINSESNRLKLYACFMLSYTIINSLAYYLYCRKYHYSVIKFQLNKKISSYKEMLSFSGWTLLGASANVGKNQGSAIIINFFFGTLINAAYAVASQVETFVMMFARSLGSAAVPQTTKSYSAGDIQRAISLTRHISKYTFVLMAFISFPIIIEIDFLLGIWLKDVPKDANLFCQLIILANLIGCLGEGIPNLINACGNIKGYQIVVHTVLFAGLPISFLLYKFGFPHYTICIVYCCVNFINSFVKLFMLHRVVKFNIIEFVKNSHIKIIFMAIPLVAYYIFIPSQNSLSGHLLNLFCSIIFFLLILVVFGLNKVERKKIYSFARKKIRI
jgi:O-antigen/teichoic acid export membrane protein